MITLPTSPPGPESVFTHPTQLSSSYWSSEPSFPSFITMLHCSLLQCSKTTKCAVWLLQGNRIGKHWDSDTCHFNFRILPSSPSFVYDVQLKLGQIVALAQQPTCEQERKVSTQVFWLRQSSPYGVSIKASPELCGCVKANFERGKEQGITLSIL